MADWPNDALCGFHAGRSIRSHLGLGHAALLDRAQGNTGDGPLEVSLSLRRRGYDQSPTAPCLSRRPPSRHNAVRKQRRRERNSCPRRSTKFPSTGPSAPGSTRRNTKRCTRARSKTRTRSGASTASASTGSSPITKVKNVSFDPHNVSIKWFEDGVTNVAYNCIDRHLPNARASDRDHLGRRRSRRVQAHHLRRIARAGRPLRQCAEARMA